MRTRADAAGPNATLDRRMAFLRRRMEALTEELNRVKALLSEYSRGGAQNGQ